MDLERFTTYRIKMTLFKEGENYSWRKIMTAGGLICFMTAQLGYLITHNFDQLPDPYWIVDAGIFGFYFGKSFFRGMALKSTE